METSGGGASGSGGGLLGGGGRGQTEQGVSTRSGAPGAVILERLRAQMATLATEGSNPQVTGDAPLDTGDARETSDAPLDRKTHRDWLEVTFWGDYPRETKSRLVTDFLQAATGRGDLVAFENYSLPDSQAGRLLTIPVKGCRCETGRWLHFCIPFIEFYILLFQKNG